jgi:hypothetical protein
MVWRSWAGIILIPIILHGSSQFDREHAWPWYSYIIVSVMSGSPAEMTSWRLNDDRQDYSAKVSKSATALELDCPAHSEQSRRDGENDGSEGDHSTPLRVYAAKRIPRKFPLRRWAKR